MNLAIHGGSVIIHPGKEQARKWFSEGFRHLKTKLIGNLEEDTARIKAIRSVAPDGAYLQGDANCGYKTLEDARRAVQELGKAGSVFLL